MNQNFNVLHNNGKNNKRILIILSVVLLILVIIAILVSVISHGSANGGFSGGNKDGFKELEFTLVSSTLEENNSFVTLSVKNVSKKDYSLNGYRVVMKDSKGNELGYMDSGINMVLKPGESVETSVGSDRDYTATKSYEFLPIEDN